jgi:hypothetical protein
MRSLALTDCGHGRGRGARWAALLAAGGIAALALVAVFSGQGVLTDAEAPRVQGAAALFKTADFDPLPQQARAAAGELAIGTGDVSSPHLHRPLTSVRGRAGFSPDLQAVQRAVRARQDAIVTAMGQRLRCVSVSASVGYVADRPTIVTRPLRGPPERG